MSLVSLQPREAGSVPVRVQVIDLEPFALDMVVPTYLPAKDLTQRVARDAGLGAFWQDGTRRQFYLRARGRLLEPHEKLEELGIVPGELIHLLPEPPAGSSVEERPPEYPPNLGYAGAGNWAVLGSLAVLLGWALLWTITLVYNQGFLVGFTPALALALLSTGVARHTWGGEGSALRVPLTAYALSFLLLMLVGLGAYVPAFQAGTFRAADLATTLGPAVLGVVFGVLFGWLAWYGAVEPLPRVTEKQVKEVEAALSWPCGICGLPVTQEVKADCNFACGRVFHRGCISAKKAIHSGEGCAVCGFRPA